MFLNSAIFPVSYFEVTIERSEYKINVQNKKDGTGAVFMGFISGVDIGV